MKILVAVKRVIDPYLKVRIKADQTGVETENVKMSMNPFDEIAIEQAIRFKESQQASEVVAVSIGSDASQETLRTALALGADRSILVQTNETWQPLNIAKILQLIVEREKPQLILLGKQAIDDDCNQTGQMLAALLNYAQGCFASKIELSSEHVLVTSEMDGGLVTTRLQLPAVVTTDLRLNEPRYATLPNIMKAKKKPLEILLLSDLGLSLSNRQRVISVKPPATRQMGIKLADAEELVTRLLKDRVL